MSLVNVATRYPDANNGLVGPLDRPIGNKEFGQRVFISGVERPIETATPAISWYAFETITVSTTALNLTEGLAEQASVVLITVEAQAVRFRFDGVASPTASVGHILAVGDTITLNGFWEIDKFQAIRKDGSDATLAVSYGYRRYD